MKVDITVAAEADLEVIGNYIARDNPVRAASCGRDLYHCGIDIADTPEA